MEERFQSSMQNVTVSIKSATIEEDKSRAYIMLVHNADTGNLAFECEVDNSMNGQFYTQTLSFVWLLNRLSGGGVECDAHEGHIDPYTQLCLSVEFLNAEDFVRFRNQYSVCLQTCMSSTIKLQWAI